ncbi:inorganic phosphate transporter [Paracoccus sphaerophysae]|uniref:inorganic phosphate transporter n=1 Tax=Paracoccus sphaerophysae TaxID=690417 RepID=UPI002FBD8E5C
MWLATGALGFALGAALYGRRLVRMVGSRITRLNPARALCVSLATALVLLGATWLGLPVSTTHVAVGGVFGVGFYREWDERRTQRSQREALPPEELHRRRLVRRTAVLRTLAAWAVTVPISGSLAAAIAWAMG